MGYDELREYLKPIVERRPIAAKNPYLLTNIGMDWERRKYVGHVDDVAKKNPFKHIKRENFLYIQPRVFMLMYGRL